MPNCFFKTMSKNYNGPKKSENARSSDSAVIFIKTCAFESNKRQYRSINWMLNSANAIHICIQRGYSETMEVRCNELLVRDNDTIFACGARGIRIE